MGSLVPFSPALIPLCFICLVGLNQDISSPAQIGGGTLHFHSFGPMLSGWAASAVHCSCFRAGDACQDQKGLHDPDAFGDMDEDCDDMVYQDCPFEEPMSAEVEEKKDEVSSFSPVIADSKKSVGGAVHAFDDPDDIGEMDADCD